MAPPVFHHGSDEQLHDERAGRQELSFDELDYAAAAGNIPPKPQKEDPSATEKD